MRTYIDRCREDVLQGTTEVVDLGMVLLNRKRPHRSDVERFYRDASNLLRDVDGLKRLERSRQRLERSRLEKAQVEKPLLDAFDSEGFGCRKCAGPRIRPEVEYIPKWVCPQFNDTEHLHVTCVNCGYVAHTATADMAIVVPPTSHEVM